MGSDLGYVPYSNPTEQSSREVTIDDRPKINPSVEYNFRYCILPNL